MGGAFPELKRNPQKVSDQILDEEDGFLRTLDRGIKLFNDIAERDERRTAASSVSGEEAFKLHDTYGVLIDITSRWRQEQGLTVDMAGYEKAMEEAKNEGSRRAGRSSR